MRPQDGDADRDGTVRNRRKWIQPDFIYWDPYANEHVIVEVKTGRRDKPRFTPNQREFFRVRDGSWAEDCWGEWRGAKVRFRVEVKFKKLRALLRRAFPERPAYWGRASVEDRSWSMLAEGDPGVLCDTGVAA
jgi:hypothetical protein